MLGIWPAVPIAIWASRLRGEIEENAIAALEHEGRVSQISVYDNSNHALRRFVEAMNRSFPALDDLSIESKDCTSMVLPDSFLGGCAPRLRSLRLHNVAFLALPKLLLSATGLVNLSLSHVTRSERLSPEVVVNFLSLLTVLERFSIEFKPSGRHLNQSNRRPCSARTVLPALTTLFFQGMTEYFDDFFPAFNAPLLKHVGVQFFDPPTFDFMRITSLLGLTETFEMPHQAYILFAHRLVDVIVSPRKSTEDDKMLRLSMVCGFSGCYLTQAYYPSPSSSLQFTVEDGRQHSRSTTVDGETTHWLELLRHFPATENLYLFERVAPCIAFALQELAQEEVAGVLPALQNLFIENLQSSGPVEDAIGKFAAARKLSGHLVTVQCWVRGRGQ